MKKCGTNQTAFSLLELLLTLLIIMILAVVIYPNYQRHISIIYRNTAKEALLNLAIKLEQYYANHNSYKNATLNNLQVQQNVASGRYQLNIDTLDSPTYSISATPQGRQAELDKNCGRLGLDEKGQPNIGGTGNIESCW